MVPEWAPLRRVLERILRDHDLEGTLSVVLVEDREMAALHGRFLDDATPTDVLSFPPGAAPRGASAEELAGEVVVSAETALREARRRGIPPERELALYAIHGTLHLAGYDDRSAVDRRRMRRAERQYLLLYDPRRGPLR